MKYRMSVKAVYLAVAGGAADVWNAQDDMSLRDLRKGASVGLQTDTPVGPVRFGVGTGEDERYTVYFSSGFDLLGSAFEERKEKAASDEAAFS